MEYFFQQTVNAVSLGGTYAMLALGLAVVFSILGLINFAHGALMTITGYTLVFLAAAGLPFGASAPIAIAVAIVAAVLMERIAFRPVRHASAATMLLTSFAVAILLQLAFQLFISTRPQPVPLPNFLVESVRVGGLSIGVNRIVAIVATAIILIALNQFLKRTRMGLAMRAAAEDFDVTRLMGIRANAVVATAFAISGALAAVAGILWISQRASVDPLMGLMPVLKAFIASVVGGLGSLTGAVAGGFLLAFIEIYLTAYLPERVLPYHAAITLTLVIAVLLFRPQGLIARRQEQVR